MDSCTLETCRCVNLQYLDFSESTIHYNEEEKIFMPHLEKLFLQQVRQVVYSPQPEVIDIAKLLQVFVAPGLRHLDLSLNQISVLNEQDMVIFSNFTYLDLSYNQLTSLYCTFLHRLTYLDVSNNKLSSIDNPQSLQNIKTLYLNDNDINCVPQPLLSTTNTPLMHTLDLNSNPLVCDCSVETLQSWLFNDKVVRLHDYYADENIYRCSYPDSQRELSITEVALDCDSPVVMYIAVSITCFIVLVISTFLVVWYRWHIQYRLFLLFHRRKIFQNNLVDDENEDEDGPPRYDAYVTYHQQDEDWVGDELEANIEGGEEPFRLCIKNRDIRAGRLIFNAISQCIQRSRKILVILSPRFVDDNWCYFQLNMAHHRVLEENSNVLIFIILEEIPNNKLTLLLRQLFCKAKCLKWPADEYGRNLFWLRLREELKRPVPLDRRFHV